MRLVLDTNVLLSGLAYPTSMPGRIVAAWRHGAVEVLLSAYILDELRRVLPKLSHRHGLSASDIEDLVDALALQAEMLEPAAVDAPALRDAQDLPVLGTLLSALKASGADYLVTGDKDLLALAQQYPIITPARFWTLHGGGT